jgi:hypothetical protein
MSGVRSFSFDWTPCFLGGSAAEELSWHSFPVDAQPRAVIIHFANKKEVT